MFLLLSIFTGNFWIHNCKNKKIPFVLEIRDLWPESIVALGAIRENSIIIKTLYATAKHIYKKSELIVVVTKTFKKHLIEYGVNKDKILIIENGFNFERTLEANKNVNNIREKYDIINNQFTVSYIGTIGASHGIEIILETAELVKDVNFLIIGEGSQKKILVENAKDRKIENVIFIDAISWQEIVNINQIISANIIHLRKLELFKTVIPSKLFESMALKKPILAGLIGESLDIIKDSNSGLQVIPEDASSLAKEILKLKNNPKLCNELAMNGSFLVNERYNRKNSSNENDKRNRKIMNLILLRHGQSKWNLENRFTGWKDVSLTQQGIEEAKYSGNIILENNYKIKSIYTSLLNRAMETTDIVAKIINYPKSNIKNEWRLNERHYGALQGLNKSETAKKYGEDQVKIWRRSFDIPSST